MDYVVSIEYEETETMRWIEILFITSEEDMQDNIKKTLKKFGENYWKITSTPYGKWFGDEE